MSTVRKAALALACALTILPSSVCAATARTAGGVSGVSGVIYPLMERYGIPGMAVGLVIDGHPYVYNYGVASKATNAPVTGDTLFEIGSVSKTFTATLASFAQVSGKLSLSDSVDAYLPSLRGSAFGRVTLLNLGTHTPGGLPLQVPDRVTNDAQLMAYLRRWKPAHAPGTYRTYSNIGIGLLGVIAAQSMSEPFDALMQSMLFPALGMKHSFIRMPSAQMKNYAQGYTESDAPIRMPAGVLGDEAYGIRTTAGDMVRFLRANMDLLVLDPKLQRAVDATHTGYYPRRRYDAGSHLGAARVPGRTRAPARSQLRNDVVRRRPRVAIRTAAAPARVRTSQQNGIDQRLLRLRAFRSGKKVRHRPACQ